MKLARVTVCGAGELAWRAPETAAQLRINVTSPGGTTAAALAHLMDAETGLPPLMERALKAAAARGVPRISACCACWNASRFRLMWSRA